MQKLGTLETMQERIDALEAQVGALIKMNDDDGYKGITDLARHFNVAVDTLRKVLMPLVAKKRIKPISLNGSSKKLYSVGEVRALAFCGK